jgi:SAM-dependent methyltransferase
MAADPAAAASDIGIQHQTVTTGAEMMDLSDRVLGSPPGPQTPGLLTLPDPPGLGMLHSRTGSGRNVPSFREERRSSRNPGTPMLPAQRLVCGEKPGACSLWPCQAPPVNREQISRLAHVDHPIGAPIDDDSVRRLLERGIPRGDARVLDLGCGGGEWLLRALTTHAQLRAEGVDISESSLTHARATARDLGVQDRLVLHHEDAADFAASNPFDLVLSVGATHAFGGLLATLAAAGKHLAPGGRVLIGDGLWAREPSSEAVEMLGNLTDLPTTVDRVIADGWTPVYGHISTRQELDDYEWAWAGSLASWALDHPADPDSSQALAAATTHRDEWLRVYRDALGFVCLILRPTSD